MELGLPSFSLLGRERDLAVICCVSHRLSDRKLGVNLGGEKKHKQIQCFVCMNESCNAPADFD